MSASRWTDDLATGNAHIDADHKGLFALVDQLKDAAASGDRKAVVSHALDVFRSHVADHFPMEEGEMAAKGYPGLDHHIAAHRSLGDLVVDLIQRDNQGQTILYSEVEHLAQALYRHILIEDKPYAAFVNGR
jgi:hemerythrin-like metal-binding protein